MPKKGWWNQKAAGASDMPLSCMESSWRVPWCSEFDRLSSWRHVCCWYHVDVREDLGRLSNCFRARSRSLDRTGRLAAAASTSTAGEARDDDVEDCDDSVDDGLEDGTDSVNDGHQGSANGAEHRGDLTFN